LELIQNDEGEWFLKLCELCEIYANKLSNEMLMPFAETSDQTERRVLVGNATRRLAEQTTYSVLFECKEMASYLGIKD
jgi:hypothetical protein